MPGLRDHFGGGKATRSTRLVSSNRQNRAGTCTCLSLLPNISNPTPGFMYFPPIGPCALAASDSKSCPPYPPPAHASSGEHSPRSVPRRDVFSGGCMVTAFKEWAAEPGIQLHSLGRDWHHLGSRPGRPTQAPKPPPCREQRGGWLTRMCHRRSWKSLNADTLAGVLAILSERSPVISPGKRGGGGG